MIFFTCFPIALFSFIFIHFISPVKTIDFLTLTPKTYSYAQLNNINHTRNYLLTRQESSHSYLIIEIGEEPKNSSIPLSYISYSFEPYSESPSYSNFTGALFANQVDFGRTVLFASLENMNEEEGFIFSVYYLLNDFTEPINYIIKYKSCSSMDEFVAFDFINNRTINSYHLRRSAYVDFHELFSSPNGLISATYNIKFYPKINVHNIDSVYTIYQKSDLTTINQIFDYPNLNGFISQNVSLLDDN